MPSIDIAANTREAERNLGRLDDSLDDVKDTLKDVAHEAGVTDDKFEKSFKSMKKTAKDTGKAISHESHEGFKDFKEESASSAKEAAASFSGSADDIGSTLQEVAANAFGGFGPAGAAAGLVAAAGLGVVMTAINEQNAALDELRQKFADVYRSAAEDGRDYLNEAEIQSGVLDLLFDSTDNFAKRKDAEKEAKLLGQDLITVARARAGSEEDINKLIQDGTRLAGKMNDKQKEQSGTTSLLAVGVQSVVTKYKDQLALQHQLSDATKQNADAQKVSQQKQRDQIDLTKQKLRDMVNGKYVANVKVQVDDSQYRRWQPQPKTVELRVTQSGRRAV